MRTYTGLLTGLLNPKHHGGQPAAGHTATYVKCLHGAEPAAQLRAAGSERGRAATHLPHTQHSKSRPLSCVGGTITLTACTCQSGVCVSKHREQPRTSSKYHPVVENAFSASAVAAATDDYISRQTWSHVVRSSGCLSVCLSEQLSSSPRAPPQRARGNTAASWSRAAPSGRSAARHDTSRRTRPLPQRRLCQSQQTRH